MTEGKRSSTVFFRQTDLPFADSHGRVNSGRAPSLLAGRLSPTSTAVVPSAHLSSALAAWRGSLNRHASLLRFVPRILFSPHCHSPSYRVSIFPTLTLTAHSCQAPRPAGPRPGFRPKRAFSSVSQSRAPLTRHFSSKYFLTIRRQGRKVL